MKDREQEAGKYNPDDKFEEIRKALPAGSSVSLEPYQNVSVSLTIPRLPPK